MDRPLRPPDCHRARDPAPPPGQLRPTHADSCRCFANDPGEEVCPNGDDPDQCEKKDRKVLQFPERLRLFLNSAGYKF